MSGLPALVNGVPAADVSVTDRGLHYGDGVFRTVRVTGGRPRGWAMQCERLDHDCGRLGLPAPEHDTLDSEAARLFEDGGDGVLKLVVTRGIGGRGYAPPESPAPTRLLLRYPLPPDDPDSGLAIGLCDTPIGRSPALAGIKHLNRLEQVLARRECEQQGWAEGLMRTRDGRVVCGVMSNLFVVAAGTLRTPAISDAGVAGATRQRILDHCAADGRTVEVGDLALSDVRRADEVFLCNSVREVRPVVRLGEASWPVGPVTRWCQSRLDHD